MPRFRRIVFWLAIAVWVLPSTGIASKVLYHFLESQHHRPPPLAKPPGAIVMLSGMLEDFDSDPPTYEFSSGADRFIEMLRLAHRYPQARIVFSGGSGRLFCDDYSEAKLLGQLAKELGVSPTRLLIDGQSRNTHENALHSKRLLNGIQGPILLVTSAYHMPRSVASFKKVGLKVIPWPVDFMEPNLRWWGIFPKGEFLHRSWYALREYAGLLAYWVAGYI